MDKTSLVSDDVEEGRRFVASLNRAGLPVAVAMWFKTAASESWMLGIVTPNVATQGPLSVIRFAEGVRQDGFTKSISRESLTFINASSDLLSSLDLPPSLTADNVLTIENVNLNGADVDRVLIFHIARDARPSDKPRHRARIDGRGDGKRVA